LDHVFYPLSRPLPRNLESGKAMTQPFLHFSDEELPHIGAIQAQH